MSLFAAALVTAVWLSLAAHGAALLMPTRAVDGDVPSTRPIPGPPDAAQLADLLSAIAADTRTGTSLAAALQAHQLPIRGFRRAQSAPEPAEDRDVAVVAHAVATARALGGPPAATLDAAAAVLRERAAHRAEAAVHSAQARLSARVLTGVPLAFTLWSALTSPSFRTAVTSPIGVAAATLGAALNLCGWGWMRRSIRRAVP